MCSRCLPKANAIAKAWQAKNRAKGLCPSCAKPAEKGRLCEGCRAKQRADYRARVQAGVCTSCQAPATAGQFCEEHWFRQVRVTHKLGPNGVAILRRLWAQQGGRCAITGDLLVPGGNASLDHITPRSKGGTSDEANLQWVTTETNWYKGDRSLTDLREWCRKVAANAPKPVAVVPPMKTAEGVR